MRISDWSSDVCSSDLSKPVVSVSKIISRIEALIWTLSGVETRGDEANLTARLAFGAARFDDEIGTRPLDAIGNLQAADHLQLRRGHKTEDRGVGKEWGRTCKTRGSPDL